MKWKEVRIFISSTFNDMHAERDYLVTDVFPVLREWCEERRIRLTDIDLRWGVSKEDAESGNTIRACLNSIDESRPFFLCFLGQRRGWVPDLSVGVEESTLNQYKGLREMLGNSSITEMEIEHATLAPMTIVLNEQEKTPEKCRALFFFRENPFHSSMMTSVQEQIYTNAAAHNEAEQDRLLAASKERIRRGWETFNYSCRWDPNEETAELAYLGDAAQGRLVDFTVNGVPLSEVIIRELQKRIEQEFPDNIPVETEDPYDEDALAQHLYAQNACYEFTGCEEEWQRIRRFLSEGPVAWAENQGHALFVTGPEGYGKTTLLTKVWQVLRANNYGALYRAIKATDKSSTVRDLYLSIGNEAGLFRASDLNRKQIDHVIDEDFLLQLQKKGFRLLILDGLDRLEDIRNLVDQLTRIPGGFYLIVSSDVAGDWASMEFIYKTMEMRGLLGPEARDSYIEYCLLHLLKKLDRSQMDTLVSVPGAVSPLFLRIVLNEVKNFGSYAQLTEKLSRFGDNIEEAFMEVLHTAETEVKGAETDPCNLFSAIISLLVYSNRGLNEEELIRGLEALGFGGYRTPEVRRVIRRMRLYLFRTDYRYNIQHSGLRNAVASRYADIETDIHRALASVYEENLRKASLPQSGIPHEINGASELLYHLEVLGDWNAIRRVLTDDAVFPMINPLSYARTLTSRTVAVYQNGALFRFAGTSDRKEYSFRQQLGFTQQDKTGENLRILKILAELFAGKACEMHRDLQSNYSKPYDETCRESLADHKYGRYFQYRNLCCNIVQLTRLTFFYTLEAILAEEDKKKRKDFFLRIRELTKEPLTFTANVCYAARRGKSYTGMNDASDNTQAMAEEMFRFEYRSCKSLADMFPKGYPEASDYNGDVLELM